MSARTVVSTHHVSTREAAKKTQGPGISISVADQFTGRSARAIASVITRGDTKDDYTSRDVEARVEILYGENEHWGTDTNSGTSVAFKASTYRHSGELEIREIILKGAVLGDLPLIVLALQEAIRIGVEQGSFCSLSPNAQEIARDIVLRMNARTIKREQLLPKAGTA